MRIGCKKFEPGLALEFLSLELEHLRVNAATEWNLSYAALILRMTRALTLLNTNLA